MEPASLCLESNAGSWFRGKGGGRMIFGSVREGNECAAPPLAGRAGRSADTS